MKRIHTAVLLISVLPAVVAGAPPERALTSYPYIARPERALAIREGYQRVALGMAPADVAKVLGEPDEVRPLYEPRHKKGKVVGYTQWYIIKRLAASGSVSKKQESLVRVSFGLDDRVSKVDAWGF